LVGVGALLAEYFDSRHHWEKSHFISQMSVTLIEVRIDLIRKDRLESRRLKAEVEETRPGEKGENGVLGRRWMGHGVGGAMRNSRNGSSW
jgi:hypothetical protein